jgi:hypothetical protein
LRKKNIKEYANAIVATKGNKKRAYKIIHPNTTDETAAVEGNKIYHDPNVMKPACEILESVPELKAKAVLQSLKDDIKSTRLVAVKRSHKIYRERDNANILEAKKTVLKLYGMLKDAENTPRFQINNFELSPEAVQRFTDAIHEARLMDEQVAKKEAEIQDADVIL